MNNQIDIGRMYGLNSADESTMNNADTMYSNMYGNYPPMQNSEISERMCRQRRMGMHNSQSMMPQEWNKAGTEPPMQNEDYTSNNTQLAVPTQHHTMQSTQGTGNIIIKSPYTQVASNVEFMNDLLRTHIGKMAEVEFLIGNNSTHIRRGQLTGVGTNYIVLEEYSTGRTMIADFYDIKFVTIYDNTYR